jgi:elongation factor G
MSYSNEQLNRARLKRQLIQIENKAWRFDVSPDVKPEEIDIPESERPRCIEFRQALIEKLAESDDHILAAYLDGKDIAPHELRAALRRVRIYKGEKGL